MKKKDALEKMKEFVSDSEMTEEDALFLGRQVTKGAFKRHKIVK